MISVMGDSGGGTALDEIRNPSMSTTPEAICPECFGEMWWQVGDLGSRVAPPISAGYVCDACDRLWKIYDLE